MKGFKIQGWGSIPYPGQNPPKPAERQECIFLEWLDILYPTIPFPYSQNLSKYI